MIHYIEKAAANFSLHQLEIESQKATPDIQLRTFIAYIDIIDAGGASKRVYIGCEHALMQRIAEVYLFEDESDEQTLTDLSLEVANMVIGSAKVIAEEEDIEPFTITTPHFEKYDVFDINHHNISAIAIDGHIMNIAIKEL